MKDRLEPSVLNLGLARKQPSRRLSSARRSARFRTGAFGIPYPRLGGRVTDRQLSLLMVAPALSLMVFYVLYPLWVVVSSSFMSFSRLAGPGTWVGLDNYRWLIEGQQFLPALGKSVYYTVANIVLQTILGLLIAVLLNLSLPGRNLARGVILFPFIVPGVVAAFVWNYMFDDLTGVVNYVLLSTHVLKDPIGWLSSPATAMNTVVAISIWKYEPVMIILFLARLQTVPTEIVEAARVDGANALQLLRYVVLPWMLPVVMIAIMLRTITMFNEFDLPYLLTQGGPLSSTLTLPVVIRQLLVGSFSPGRASAVSTVMIGFLVLFGLLSVALYRRAERAFQE